MDKYKKNKQEINKRFKEELDKQIAENIQQIRRDKNMTQAVLAEKIGLSHEFVRRILSKKGKKSFSIPTVIKIANALKVNPSVIMDIDLDKLDVNIEDVILTSYEE